MPSNLFGSVLGSSNGCINQHALLTQARDRKLVKDLGLVFS